MQKVLKLYKPVGSTPLEIINQFKNQNHEYKDKKLCYAGRLDPMAEGLLLVLVGEECKKRKEYERLSKTYEFEVLIGISTDTFDILGKIKSINPSPVSKEQVDKIIQKYSGEILQEYPPYSSPRIKGKPLFWWARENRLSEIRIPEKKISIFNFQLLNIRKVNSKDLLRIVQERILIVAGNFRQKEILKNWDKKLKGEKKHFLILKLRIKCSSGTYVRSIANEIGKELKKGALAFSIKRINIGNFSLSSIG